MSDKIRETQIFCARLSRKTREKDL